MDTVVEWNLYEHCTCLLTLANTPLIPPNPNTHANTKTPNDVCVHWLNELSDFPKLEFLLHFHFCNFFSFNFSIFLSHYILSLVRSLFDCANHGNSPFGEHAFVHTHTHSKPTYTFTLLTADSRLLQITYTACSHNSQFSRFYEERQHNIVSDFLSDNPSRFPVGRFFLCICSFSVSLNFICDLIPEEDLLFPHCLVKCAFFPFPPVLSPSHCSMILCARFTLTLSFPCRFRVTFVTLLKIVSVSNTSCSSEILTICIDTQYNFCFGIVPMAGSEMKLQLNNIPGSCYDFDITRS